ncbi:MAG: phospholipid-binding protein MlaC [Lautropia sp.]
MNRTSRIAARGAALVASLCLATAALAQQAPNAFIETLSNKVIEQVRGDSKIQSGDVKGVAQLVETTLMPNVNFERMTALSVGRAWREATPDQKQKVMEEFRILLLRTYANAFTAVKDQTIRMKPFRGEASDEVIVRSEVVQPRGEPIQLDYRLEKAGEGWKIYDVNVLGVWLVQTYRNQFAQEISAGGLDGLIKSLAEKNKAFAPALKS